MIGFLLISHGSFGDSLLHNVCHILGERPPLIERLAFAPHDDLARSLEQATSLTHTLDQGEGVLIFTDILGATPANIAKQLLRPGKIEGVSGLSLPMLLRALTYRESGMNVLIQKAIAGGHDGIEHMNTKPEAH